MSNEHLDGLLTALEAARFLRVSLATLRRMEKSGHLVPFRTLGGHRRYSTVMLDEYLQRSRKLRPATTPHDHTPPGEALVPRRQSP